MNLSSSRMKTYMTVYNKDNLNLLYDIIKYKLTYMHSFTQRARIESFYFSEDDITKIKVHILSLEYVNKINIRIVQQDEDTHYGTMYIYIN